MPWAAAAWKAMMSVSTADLEGAELKEEKGD
jgi:hypothetical protein